MLKKIDFQIQFGSQTDAAKAMNVSRVSISKWLRLGRIPEKLLHGVGSGRNMHNELAAMGLSPTLKKLRKKTPL